MARSTSRVYTSPVAPCSSAITKGNIMVDNHLSDAWYCPYCNKEIEYDGSCDGCETQEEVVDIDDIMDNMNDNLCVIRDALEYYFRK